MEISEKDVPVLFDAIQRKNIRILDILINKGCADIDHADEKLGTALHYFASQNYDYGRYTVNSLFVPAVLLIFGL